MVKFISENWANILLIIVGSFALATYILQERKKKIDAASLIVLQIDEFQERLREISTFIVDGQLNETAFYESLPLMEQVQTLLGPKNGRDQLYSTESTI